MLRVAKRLALTGLFIWTVQAVAQPSASSPSEQSQSQQTGAPAESSSPAPQPNPPAQPSSSPAQQSTPAPPDKAAEKPAAEKPADEKPAAEKPAAEKPAAPGNPPTPDDICRAIEQDAADNGLPVEFFARVIWQESRFNAQAVSPKGALGIAQFMPATAGYRGLADPFDPIAALKESASYLRELRDQFGNLGLAAAAYNAGPGRVSAFVNGHRPLPGETRNYVAIITGWTADDWIAPKPPQTAETTIPQGVPCARLANLILAPKDQARRIAAYVPRWGMQLTADWSEGKAWALYRSLQKKYAGLIGDREPIVLRARMPGMGAALRYEIRIADDNRGYLEKFCQKLMAAGGACLVLRNDRG